MRVIDGFAADYGEALADICWDVEDLDVWEGMLDDTPDVEDGYSEPSSRGAGKLRKKLEELREGRVALSEFWCEGVCGGVVGVDPQEGGVRGRMNR